jgi:tetratricopeptide (TPR) repeat protein
VIPLLVVSIFLGQSPAEIGAHVSRAALLGDAAALEEARSELRTALDTTDDAEAAELRYVLAYTDWRLANRYERGAKEAKSYLEEAESQLEELLQADPENAEAQALYATINGARIGSMFSGMRRGPRASKAFEKALELEPKNPRVHMQQGISRLFRPAMFGGGVDKAEAELERARELFEAEAPEKSWPDWGRVEIYAWLGVTMARKEDYESARQYYEKALELEPEYEWVRDTLLPQLDAAPRQKSGKGV